MFGHVCCRDIVHVFVCVQRRLRNDLACVLSERPCLMPVFSEIISVDQRAPRFSSAGQEAPAAAQPPWRPGAFPAVGAAFCPQSPLLVKGR